MKIKLTRYTYALLLLLLILLFPEINAQSIVKKSASDSLKFLVISDFGGQGGEVQRKVGEQLGREASLEKSRFVITCGDNYHQSGISSFRDPRWKTEFEDIYSDNSLMIPWYASLGNHDYNGNPQAQIEYSQISKRWHLPSRYYSHTEKINDTTDVLFIHLDTSPFITEYRKKDSIYHISGQDIKMQLGWLDSVLSHSYAHWKIVIGHHPIYSSVEKRGNTGELIDQVLPLLEKYNVQIYFCGHEHFMQYLVDGSVNSFICGSAALTRPASSREDVKFGSDTPGFLSVTVTYNIAQVNFINDKGICIYSAIVDHKK
jgi:predicted MPP superfamily phosphohydrolase